MHIHILLCRIIPFPSLRKTIDFVDVCIHAISASSTTYSLISVEKIVGCVSIGSGVSSTTRIPVYSMSSDVKTLQWFFEFTFFWITMKKHESRLFWGKVTSSFFNSVSYTYNNKGLHTGVCLVGFRFWHKRSSKRTTFVRITYINRRSS